MFCSQNRSQTRGKFLLRGGAVRRVSAARPPHVEAGEKWPKNGKTSLVLYYITLICLTVGDNFFCLSLTRVNALKGKRLDLDSPLFSRCYFRARSAYRETSPATNSGNWRKQGAPARGSRTESGTATLPRWQARSCPHSQHESTMSAVSTGALQLLTLPEVAQRLGVHRRSVERLIAAGEFPRPLKVGAATRVPVSDLQAYVARLMAQRGSA